MYNKCSNYILTIHITNKFYQLRYYDLFIFQAVLGGLRIYIPPVIDPGSLLSIQKGE